MHICVYIYGGLALITKKLRCQFLKNIWMTFQLSLAVALWSKRSALLSFTPLIQMLFATCISRAMRSSEKSKSFPAQCRSWLSSSVSPASALVLQVSCALWTWFWPLWCLSVPTFKCITSPSPARQQGLQSGRMGSALGPTPHTCSRSHTSVGKELFTAEESTGTKLHIFLNIYIPQLLLPARKSNGWGAVSLHFWEFLLFKTSVRQVQGVLCDTGEHWAIGGSLWLFTVFLPGQYLRPSSFCYTPDSQMVSPFFSAIPLHCHHGREAFLLITCVLCSLHKQLPATQ